MAMSSLWNQFFNDIDWGRVSAKGKQLNQSARRNLIFVSAICALGGSLSAGLGLIGSYSPRVSYCDPRTKPCTNVEVNFRDELPINIDVRYLPGYGLQRTAGSVAAVILFGAGLFTIAKAEEEQEELEPQLQLDKQLAVQRMELQANTELQNLENLAQTRVEVHEQELKESVAEMFFERNPEAIAQYLPKPEAVPEPVKPQIVEEPEVLKSEPKLEPEIKKIPPGIEMMLNSDLAEVANAGILNLVGAQGSGKTTTSCMLLRYRIWKGHKLIIVNPHKKKSMYAGLESYLMPGSKFYGVGIGDFERAQSLMDGLNFILQHISDRYDEYQNLDESEYNHFPVTILLEECAEYDGLLSVFNRPPNPKEEDPGFSAKKYVTNFWKKFFIATRKGNNWGLRTIQFDSNTMNGTEGMADLIKSQGACTLTQYSIPDGDCFGGWRSTGEAEIKLPNMKDSEGKIIDSKPCTVPTWFDYKKILDPNDFQDLAPAVKPSSEKVKEVVKEVQHPTPDDPETLLKQNLDRILEGFERSLSQSIVSQDASTTAIYPEIEEVVESIETETQQPEPPVLPEGAMPLVEEKRFTPMSLSRVDLIAIAKRMQLEGVSQTKIVEQLWDCKKSAAGWSKAYREFRSLGL